MNVNQKLILVLTLGCLTLSKSVDTNSTSNFDPHYSSVQSDLTLNDGA